MFFFCKEVIFFPFQYFKYSSKDKNDGKIFGGTTAEKFPLRLASLVYEDWLEQKPKNWPNFNATARLVKCISF